ncbi:HAMP domain-containing sensor histidine kinase [Oscillibacter sp.]|uniref:sensor histidine kinase n=1 Tax=Oscillibacter sp. TaxID=1945593 RepID=UPI00262CECA5|nr:HAMP domain-containing sensor histidine kinase [Oscillibacter sp.]MDD3347824.1 HAMP domain-containing sensor histidine kinase [Oscillibacter sp.]
MIVQLQKKFVLITMGSLVLVLTVLMAVLNITNYLKLDRNAGAVLELLVENGGTFPDDGKHPQWQEDQPPPEGAVPAGVGIRRPGFTAETPYETRFFSVLLQKDGAVSYVNTGKIAAITAQDAISMAQSLWSRDDHRGYSGNYKFLSSTSQEGTLYVFLDCTRNLTSFQNFLSISALVSLAGILAVFVLVMALSRRAIRPVAESYEKQKQFITNAGHEIKTPLAIIDSCTEVLKLEQGESKWTNGIRAQVHRLSALTENLVSLARMDEGGGSLPMAEFDLSAAVSETLEPFALLAKNRALHLEQDLEASLILRGNEQTIRELISILADNAVKYALPESTIRFALSRRGRHSTLTAENTAEGLQKGDQSLLFDRFYRGDASRSSEKRGYGIGLSMAQSIVAAHGGRIEAKSPEDGRLLLTIQL